MDFEHVRLKNVILKEAYAIDCQPYEYLFFQIPEAQYPGLEKVVMDIRVLSNRAKLVLNEYRGTEKFEIAGKARVEFEAGNCEAGENVLAYKGQIQIENIEMCFMEEWSRQDAGKADSPPSMVSPVKAAAEFLLRSQIPSQKEKSRFDGSCYAIYDYSNGCHRMPCWLWSDAPIVSAALGLVRSGCCPELECV